jgi:cytochrome c553
MKQLLYVLPLVAGMAWADTPNQFVASYSAEAARAQAGFVADATRGRAFAARDWGVSTPMPGCTTCHTAQPQNPGRHAVTGKRIAPLSPRAQADRFSDPAKVEKWFKRNCNEVVGRLCTPAEKADFVAYVMAGQ